jgi:hypothetical protein
MSLVPDDEYVLHYESTEHDTIARLSKTTDIISYYIKPPVYGRITYRLFRLFSKRYPTHQAWANITRFFDYGKLKAFRLRYEQVGEHIYLPVITFHKSYLTSLENSPEIPEPDIDTLYGIGFFSKMPGQVAGMRIKRLSEINKFGPCSTITIRGSLQDLDKVREMIGESRLVGVGIYVMRRLDGCSFEYLIEADPESKVILNKLIYIYTHISDFLKKKGITLKDILEDVDLYVAVAAATAT